MPNRHNHVKAEMLLMLILSIQLSAIIMMMKMTLRG